MNHGQSIFSSPWRWIVNISTNLYKILFTFQQLEMRRGYENLRLQWGPLWAPSVQSYHSILKKYKIQVSESFLTKNFSYKWRHPTKETVSRCTYQQDFSLLHVIQTGSGAHPASYPMGTGTSFPGGKADEGWSWPHLQLVPRSRKCGSNIHSPIRLNGVVLN
jgi:hypothetical protein